MLHYVIKRLLLMIPTLLGIMVINFVIVQAAPGGPVEQSLAKIRGVQGSSTERVSGTGSSERPRAVRPRGTAARTPRSARGWRR